MGNNNYIALASKSIRYKFFCFIDTEEYLADQLFIKNKIRVWFQSEARKQDTEYVFIICKVKKCDEDIFLRSLEELKRKMLLMGHLDYEKFCTEFHEKMIEEGKV